MKARERIAVYNKLLLKIKKNNVTEIDLHLWNLSKIKLRDIPHAFPELKMVLPANVMPNKDYWNCDKAGNDLRRHAVRKMIMFAKQTLRETLLVAA